MRIIDRYLIKNFISPIFYCLLLFSIIFVVIDTFNNLDEFLRYSVSPRVILTYYFYLLPSLWVQIVPIATLVGVLYSVGNFNRHNEIVALKASGVSAVQILTPYLCLGIVISFFMFLVNEIVVPPSKITSTAIMDGLILKGKKNLDERAIKNVTLYGKKNRMIYAREYELSTQTLHDVVIFENSQTQTYIKSKLVSKKAVYFDDRWVFYEVMRYELNHRGDIVGDPQFLPKLTLEMEEKPEDFLKEASQVEFMSAKQLKVFIEQTRSSGRKLAKKLWVDFYYKIAFPFVSFIVIMIGTPLAMQTKNRKNVVGIGASLGIVLAYYGLESICLALGKGGYMPPILAAWFCNILFGLVGIYLIRKTA